MKREIKIDFAGHGETYVTHLWSRETRSIGRKDVAELATPRTELTAEDVEEGRDHVYLLVGGTPWFGGVIEDVQRQDNETIIHADSWERLAEGAEPTANLDEWDNAPDSDIIRDAIADVPELTVGGVETTNPYVSLLFSHAKQSKKLRETANLSPGILRFNPDKSVDYGTLGNDKTDITLSPRRQNVESDITVDRTGGGERVTHLRLVGVGEGTHQKVANIVPASDPNTSHLENVRTYENPDWNPDDPPDWETYSDKGVVDAETLADLGETYIQELREVKVEAELTVSGLHVELGDLFRTYVPTERLDRILEVVECRRIVDPDGLRYKLVLSNYRKAREGVEEKQASDLESYNKAVEGAAVPINVSGGRQPVNQDHNYQMTVYYPSEVEWEHRLNCRVMGFPYRAYSSGARDNADFTSAVVGETTANITVIGGGWETIGTLEDPEVGTSKLRAFFPYRAEVDADGFILNGFFRFRLRAQRDDGSVGYFPNEEGFRSEVAFGEGRQSSVDIELPENIDGYTVDFQGQLESSISGGATLIGRVNWQAAGRHTHDPAFGIMETDAAGDTHWPANCHVLVNGEQVGSAFGTGAESFEESIDIRGQLREGEPNHIEVTSDQLGHALVFVEGDVYRRVRGRG